MSNEQKLAESFAPHWATGLAKNNTDIGAQLCTKDGRKVGNAVVLAWPVEDHGVQVAEILTDAGTKLRMTPEELGELFHNPTFTMDTETAPGVANLPYNA